MNSSNPSKILKVTFSRHAKSRMRLRNITMEEAIATVREPDHYHVAKDGCWEAFKSIGGKNIKVIYQMRSSTHAHVITLKKTEVSL